MQAKNIKNQALGLYINTPDLMDFKFDDIIEENIHSTTHFL